VGSLAVVSFVAGVIATALTDPVDWNEQQWGNAAEWAAGVGTVLTLLLGLGILARDHLNAERAQVDLVGAWAEPIYEPRGFDQPRVDEASIMLKVRNASQLPITVVQVGYSVYTTWSVTEDKFAYDPVSGTEPVRCFPADFLVQPGETWDNKGTPNKVNFTHTAPPDAVQLDITNGVRCQIDWLLILDNAGRKWEVRPSRGGRAKRLAWYHRPEEYQPPEFFSTVGQVLARQGWWARPPPRLRCPARSGGPGLAGLDDLPDTIRTRSVRRPGGCGYTRDDNDAIHSELKVHRGGVSSRHSPADSAGRCRVPTPARPGSPDGPAARRGWRSRRGTPPGPVH